MLCLSIGKFEFNSIKFLSSAKSAGSEIEFQGKKYIVEEVQKVYRAQSVEISDKHIEISDRATLMNILLVTDAYTVGTGIMPSGLNRGNIVSIPLNTDGFYHIGYLLNENRKISDATNLFIEMMNESMKKYHTEAQK